MRKTYRYILHSPRKKSPMVASRANTVMARNLKSFSIFLNLLIASAGVAHAQKSIAPEELNKMLGAKSKIIVVDVRPSGQFFEGHIDGAINVPFATVNAYDFPKKKTLVLYCGGTDCSLSGKAAKILMERSYKDVRVLTGGLPAWEGKGFPVIPPAPATGAASVKKPMVASKISAAELFKALPETYMVIDVRSNYEFSAGHIKGSFNLPLEGLLGNVPDSAKGKKLVVYDRRQDRSVKAAGLLAENDFTVYELTGGLGVWAALGYPVAVGAATVLK